MSENVRTLVSNFQKSPVVELEQDLDSWRGWRQIIAELRSHLSTIEKKKIVIAVDLYPGNSEDDFTSILREGLEPELLVSAQRVMLPAEELSKLLASDVTDDPIFGKLTRFKLGELWDQKSLKQVRSKVDKIEEGLILTLGVGASLITEPDVIVYGDLARWEIQKRFRANKACNLGLDNSQQKTSDQYKRAYFVDWRLGDRHKRSLFDKWQYYIDCNSVDDPKMISGESFQQVMDHVVSRPFSVVPFFDPGPWGGQWMRDVCGLDKEAPNYAWCFNCVPEENSLLVKVGSETIEMPSLNVVLSRPTELLGPKVHGRFGAEFPIRFDFLDTVEGGNLSLQVHPLTEYIQEEFGVPYTQDESYYILDADPDSKVYLGLKEECKPSEVLEDLEKAQDGEDGFDADKYIESWPVKKHDHFLIPAGTIHCSGAGSMVLEVSATPYIFTFKLWDWGRLGLDGLPRPINISRGKDVIQWDRKTQWTKENLVNQIEEIASGDGWREERTGLHERGFSETRRHWFSKDTLHYTENNLHVICLVEGREAIVESPDAKFEPFIVHYGETFIIPAQIDSYRIRPHGESLGKECGTLKAYVRG